MTKYFNRFKFPETFSLSVNPKHSSNTTESIKLLKEIVIPYVEREHRQPNLSPEQKVLLTIDVFRGQMTNPVLGLSKENNIISVRVPANMTNKFQPLDLTVSGAAKAFLKRKFTEWYSSQVTKTLDTGMKLEDIEIKLKLSELKPLHGWWKYTTICLLRRTNKLFQTDGEHQASLTH